MRIESVDVRTIEVPLTRPYTIASGTHDHVRLAVVTVRAGEFTGHGSASPAEDVTGETHTRCESSLRSEHVSALIGQDPRDPARISVPLKHRLQGAPAAVAAIDMALHDLRAQALGVPLCEALGKVHDGMATSVTIGIKDTGEALEEASEYLDRGFLALKVKIGSDAVKDVERLRALRAHVGHRTAIRVDANGGYDIQGAAYLLDAANELGLELVEQPLPQGAMEDTRQLRDRPLVCLDESVQSVEDAQLAADPPAAGSFNIKLMKCGGPSEALQIAAVAEAAGLALMWGCMDESRVSIAAALHTALACPATRYLDLDGHLDLSQDPFDGGFTLEAGVLRPTSRPGLGVSAS